MYINNLIIDFLWKYNVISPANFKKQFFALLKNSYFFLCSICNIHETQR